MNALARSAARSLPRAAPGTRTVVTAGTPESFKVPSMYKTWCTDPGTYPIVVVIAGASLAWPSFLAYKMMYCPNVRITKNTKGKVLRTWGGKN